MARSGRLGSPVERVARLTRRILEGLLEEPDAFLVVEQDLTSENVPAEIREIVRKGSLRSTERFRQVIVKGQEGGQVVQGDPAELAAAYFACVSGIAMALVSYGIPAAGSVRPETILRLLMA